MPAPSFFTRPSRDYNFVASQGSSVIVRQYDRYGVLQSTGVTLDIHEGFLRELFRNENTTHSGSNGADLYTRVGAGWNFALVTSFPRSVGLTSIDGAQAPVEVAQPFVETLLGSMRSVWMQFNIGDPDFWRALNMDPRSFRGAKAMLETVETRIDARTGKVVGLNIAGVGNSLLWTFLAEESYHPGVWF